MRFFSETSMKCGRNSTTEKSVSFAAGMGCRPEPCALACAKSLPVKVSGECTMAFVDNNTWTFRARFYFSLRFYLHKKRWLLRLVQVLRASIVLGPLRKPIIRYYQKLGNNDILKTGIHPLF